MSYKKEMIAEVVEKIKAQGFRVFLADKGTYGFFTDKEGSKVISFGVDLLSIYYSGNYKSSNPQKCGQGWKICENAEDFQKVFDASPPYWAVQGFKWSYKSVEDQIAMYGQSSKYQEV